MDALRKVEQHRDQGFTHVFRCDIRSFFDSVDHDVLRVVLECLFSRPGDVDLLMAWVSAPRVGSRGTHPGTSGLPLGLPLSGALANAYLIPFDLTVSAPNRRLVRYADDSVLCCRTPGDAQQAQADCEQSLAELRLETNRTKSYLSTFERGFSFLGWTFFGDHGFQSDRQSAWVHPLAYSR